MENRRAWPGAGACAFPSDPQASPRESPALWSPNAAPDVVILEVADLTHAIPLPAGSEPLVEVTSAAERHVVAAHGTTRIRICVRRMHFRTQPTFSIPCDSTCALRLAATSRLERVARGDSPVTDRFAMPTAYQRRRLAQSLNMLDALEAEASLRDLAFGLVFPNHRPLAGATWKGSAERRHVLRLIAEARRLAIVGHRKLLLHR